MSPCERARCYLLPDNPLGYCRTGDSNPHRRFITCAAYRRKDDKKETQAVEEKSSQNNSPKADH